MIRSIRYLTIGSHIYGLVIFSEFPRRRITAVNCVEILEVANTFIGVLVK